VLINYKKLAEYIEYKPNRWQEELSKSDVRFKVVVAGRRSGKSFYVTRDPKDGVVADLLLPKQSVWVVAPNYDLTQKIWVPIIQLVRFKFPDIVRRIWDTKGSYRLDTILDTTLEAKSAEDPERLVGSGLTKVIIDEAGLIKKKTWYESLRPTLIGTKETAVGRAIFIGTPKGKNHFYDLYLDGQNPDKPEWKSWHFTSYENEHLDKKELDKLTQDMPEYEYRQEIMAEFEETAEQLFRNIKKNIQGELIQEAQRNQFYSMGMDLGRKGAYSVISIINKRTGHLDYFDRFRKISWELQIQRTKYAIEKFRPYPITIDATGVGDPVVEELERAIKKKVSAFVFGEITKKQLIDKLAIWLEKGLVTYPYIPQLLLELERYGREIMESGKVKYKSIGSVTSDCVMALALAIWSLRELRREGVVDELIVFDAPKY